MHNPVNIYLRTLAHVSVHMLVLLYVVRGRIGGVVREFLSSSASRIIQCAHTTGLWVFDIGLCVSCGSSFFSPLHFVCVLCLSVFEVRGKTPKHTHTHTNTTIRSRVWYLIVRKRGEQRRNRSSVCVWNTRSKFQFLLSKGGQRRGRHRFCVTCLSVLLFFCCESLPILLYSAPRLLHQPNDLYNMTLCGVRACRQLKSKRRSANMLARILRTFIRSHAKSVHTPLFSWRNLHFIA